MAFPYSSLQATHVSKSLAPKTLRPLETALVHSSIGRSQIRARCYSPKIRSACISKQEASARSTVERRSSQAALRITVGGRRLQRKYADLYWSRLLIGAFCSTPTRPMKARMKCWQALQLALPQPEIRPAFPRQFFDGSPMAGNQHRKLRGRAVFLTNLSFANTPPMHMKKTAEAFFSLPAASTLQPKT